MLLQRWWGLICTRLGDSGGGNECLLFSRLHFQLPSFTPLFGKSPARSPWACCSVALWRHRVSVNNWHWPEKYLLQRLYLDGSSLSDLRKYWSLVRNKAKGFIILTALKPVRWGKIHQTSCVYEGENLIQTHGLIILQEGNLIQKKTKKANYWWREVCDIKWLSTNPR